MVRSATAPGRARTLVDPHRLTGDPTAAIDWYHPSPDGRLLAYGMSTGGDERSTLHVLDVDHGRAPARPHPRHPGRVGGLGARRHAASPTPATRHDADGDGAADQGRAPRTCTGTSSARAWPTDPLVWDDLPDTTAWANVSLSADGRWLLVHLSLGWSRIDVHLLDRAHRGPHRARSRASRPHRVRGRRPTRSSASPPSTPIAAGSCRPRSPTAWHDHWCTIDPRVRRRDRGGGVPPRRRCSCCSTRTRGGPPRPLRPRRHRPPADRPARHRARWPASTPATDRDEAFFSFSSFATPSTTYRWAGATRRRSRSASGATSPTRPTSDVRRRAGPLPVHRRHRGPDVPRPGRGHRARSPTPLHPHRLRRVLDHMGPAYSPDHRRGLRPRRRSTPSPASGAAPRKARRGTAPACASTSRTPSTTSSPPPTGWSTKGSPPASASPSEAAATAAC